MEVINDYGAVSQFLYDFVVIFFHYIQASFHFLSLFIYFFLSSFMNFVWLIVS